jgi:sulfite exporter TauE/SafE
MLLQSLLAGALAGLSSAPHCAVMCGPLCGASCSGGSSMPLALLRYQLGRTAGYAFAGALAGSLGLGLSSTLVGASGPALIAGATVLSLLLLASRTWRGARATPLLTLRTGAPSPARAGVLFATLGRLAPREPAVVGVLSALLPCGALAAGLLIAAATRDRVAGAVAMTGFAGASALGVLSGGWLLTWMTRLLGRPWPRTIAVALGVLALLLGLRPLYQAATARERAADAAAAPACH